MAKFNKRLFGQPVSDQIIEEFKRLSRGGAGGLKQAAKNIGLTGGDRDLEADLLAQQLPTFEKYLGERTPFSRMWCAVNTKEINISNGEVNDSTSKIKIFKINENKEDSYSKGSLDKINPLESSQKKDTGKIQSVSQLQTNRFSKPEAGITSVTSKTQGALGAIQSTTVEFVVHNKHDFETIFLPFFLKPGSIVCVDYGWSDQSIELYDPISKLDNQDTEMSKFDSDIYGENGFLEQNFGKVNTTMGNVVSYDANITTEGSYNCSLEIISRNNGLLDKEISEDNNLRFLFVNVFDDLLILAIAAADNQAIEVSVEQLEEAFEDDQSIVNDEGESIPNKEKKILQDKYFKDNGVGVVYNPVAGVGLSEKSSKIGILYSLYTDNTGKAFNANGEGNEAYISLGKFEDVFLNSFVSVLTKSESKTVDDVNFDNIYDSRGSYIRWDQDLHALQSIPIEKGDEQIAFILPKEWYNSYNYRKSKKSLDDFKMEKDGKMPGYEGVSVMPMRDLFISVSVITTAFKTKPTVNDALLSICDKINFDSHKIFNLKLGSSNESKAGISFIDANLLPPGDDKKQLIFDVMGETSIVSNCDLKFVTPKGGLSSIIAISNLKKPTDFDQLELGALNNLNLLNKPDGDKNYLIRSLPYMGDINEKIYKEDIGIDFAKVEARIKETQNSDNATPKASSGKAYQAYTKAIGLAKKKEDNSKKNQGPIVGPFGPRRIPSTADEPISDEKKVELSEESVDGGKIVVAESERKRKKKEIRERLYNTSGEKTVPAILPIELDLSVYGNKYLQIGDRYTISYLPEHYKKRTFFQIVGTEDKVDVNGWTTSYTSVMYVKPTTDKFFKGTSTGTDPNLKGKSKVKFAIDSEHVKKTGIIGEKNSTVDENLIPENDKVIKGPFDVPKQVLQKTAAQIYDERVLPAYPYVTKDNNSKFSTQYAVTGIERAREFDYTYNWFTGPNGEEVTIQKKIYLYNQSDGGKRIFIQPPYERKKDGIYKKNDDGINTLVLPIISDDKGLPKPQKISGRVLETNDSSQYPNKGGRGVGKNHPAYAAFSRSIKDFQIDAPMIWKAERVFFLQVSAVNAKRLPSVLYHEFHAEQSLLNKSDNLAMMYAIRNSLFKNLYFEGIKIGYNFGEEADIVIGFHETTDVLEYYNKYYDDEITTDLDEREKALATKLQDMVSSGDIPKVYGDAIIEDVEGIKVPRPIRSINFRDQNEENKLDGDGKVMKDSGSEIIAFNLDRSSPSYYGSGMFTLNKLDTYIRIPKHLLVKANTTIELIATDINRLYIEYDRSMKEVLLKNRQINSQTQVKENVGLPTSGNRGRF